MFGMFVCVLVCSRSMCCVCFGVVCLSCVCCVCLFFCLMITFCLDVVMFGVMFVSGDVFFLKHVTVLFVCFVYCVVS